MPISTKFDEELWLLGQERRAQALHASLKIWFLAQPLNAELAERLAGRVLAGEETGRTDSPALFALRMAESLGAAPGVLPRLGIAATLFWAAADVADDVDDGDEKERLFANDACALIFLSQKAFVEFSPLAVEEGIHYGLEMANGQTRDLVSTDTPHAPDVPSIVAGKAGAELEFFLTLAGIAADRVTPALRRLGRTFGAALQVFSDVADLYLKPVSSDFTAGKWTLPLLLYREGRDGNPWESLRRDRIDVQSRVRFEAAAAARQSLDGQWRPFLAAWEAVLPECADPAPFGEVVSWLQATYEALEEALTDLEEPPLPTFVKPQEAIQRGLRYLAEVDGAEEHRWGFLGKPFVSGDLFPLLFKAAALRALDGPWREALAKLLTLRDEDGWRYYPHRPEIPPDADDTGLMLGYFHDALPAGVVEDSAAQLQANFHGASIHTWMGPMPDDIHWEGDDCLATLSNVSWGLLRAGHGAKIPPAVWRRLAAAAAGTVFESPFYPPSLTRFFVHRSVAAGVAAGHLTDADGTAARVALQIQMKAEERLAGHFTDSVLTTVATVLAAVQWKAHDLGPLRPDSIAIWLSERQESDGSWAAEPFFWTPGVAMRPQQWGHSVLTTSWVLLALLELTPV